VWQMSFIKPEHTSYSYDATKGPGPAGKTLTLRSQGCKMIRSSGIAGELNGGRREDPDFMFYMAILSAHYVYQLLT